MIDPVNLPPKEKPTRPKNAHAILKTLPPPPPVLTDIKTGKIYYTGDWLGEVCLMV